MKKKFVVFRFKSIGIDDEKGFILQPECEPPASYGSNVRFLVGEELEKSRRDPLTYKTLNFDSLEEAEEYIKTKAEKSRYVILPTYLD